MTPEEALQDYCAGLAGRPAFAQDIKEALAAAGLAVVPVEPDARMLDELGPGFRRAVELGIWRAACKYRAAQGGE